MLAPQIFPVHNAVGIKYAATECASPSGPIGTATAHTVGTLRVVPVVVTFKQTISALRHGITVSGGGGSLVDLVVYESDPATGKPGRLIASKLGNDGTVVSATGADAALAANVTIKPGTYWVGSLSRVGAATQLSVASDDSPVFRGPQTASWAAVTPLNVATAVVAAVPSTFPATVWAAGPAPRVGLVFAA